MDKREVAVIVGTSQPTQTSLLNGENIATDEASLIKIDVANVTYLPGFVANHPQCDIYVLVVRHFLSADRCCPNKPHFPVKRRSSGPRRLHRQFRKQPDPNFNISARCYVPPKLSYTAVQSVSSV